MSGAFALDFGAIMAMGSALCVDLNLLADVLPRVEHVIIDSLHSEEED